MKALIIFDSFFGNTELIARAVGAALAGVHDVQVVRVGQAAIGQLAGVQLLIIGSPTRGFRPTPATVAFINSIPDRTLAGVGVATFDTRCTPEQVKNALYTPMARLFGYAAKPMADMLKRRGGRLVVAPEGFEVAGKEGPLLEGELEHAAGWAQRITMQLVPLA